MKTCTDCNIPKDQSDFYKSKSSEDGFMSNCKSCQKARAKKNYQENKENRIDSIQSWKDSNRKKDLEYKRNSYRKRKSRSKNSD